MNLGFQRATEIILMPASFNFLAFPKYDVYIFIATTTYFVCKVTKFI